MIILLSSNLYGQISPGDLTTAHAKYEGISNCTQCHVLGNKVTSAKCLACHTEIQGLVKQNRGYHADKLVKGKDCFACHSEHHGRNFKMIRLDEKKFNHEQTGYSLKGEHKVIDCRECHKPENIASKELKKRKDTFLGLGKACLSCHDDYHQKTLSNDCASCHDFTKFTPAPNFNHNKAKFKLTGKHIDVKCIECHKKTIQNQVEMQQFTGIKFDDCVNCHKDPHAGHFTNKCAQCHTDQSFTLFNGKKSFDHNKTKFTLNGSHKNVDCFECHKNNTTALTVFQDRNGINETDCITCHKDFHEGKFGENCAQCHIEKSFHSLKTMDFFDHNLTDYPLEGKHINVDCKKCHADSYVKPINFSECKNCHKDFHEGQFVKNGVVQDCKTCHSLAEGFDISQFTIEEHEKTKFPLNGSHLAVPCLACHQENKKWNFKDIGTQCIDCHDDVHKNTISETIYPIQNCTVCHQTESWQEISFNHNKTPWKLEGKHSEVNCNDCHWPDKNVALPKGLIFKTLKSECNSCHENIHGNQFAIDQKTDCKRCHDSEKWIPPPFFNHNNTKFALTGKHAQISCAECHKPQPEVSSILIYKINKHECKDCHI